MSQGVPLWLDHVSVSVPRLHEAISHLSMRLGLRATVSPGDPERHSRVYLHRGYIEVAADPRTAGWNASLFFLRFDDPVGLRALLDAVGLPYRFDVYTGVDGSWDDVEIGNGGEAVPILVRRTEPPDIARSWPPALERPHECGAITLESVHVAVPEWDRTLDVYRHLLEAAVTTTGAGAGPRTARVPLARGSLMLTESETSGIDGVVLGVERLEEPRARFGSLLVSDQYGLEWLDPSETFGVRLGFTAIGEPCRTDS